MNNEKLPMWFYCIIILFLGACNSQEKINEKKILEDVAQASGLSFKHDNGMIGTLSYIEIMGSGVALFDYDNDGDLDVYLGQGEKIDTLDNVQQFGRLFRSDLENGELQFKDVTLTSGLISKGYNMGVATGDINNDGYTDIYLTNYGKNQLFLNHGDGTFSDISKSSKTDINDWSISASLFDFNNDGYLDIYVANYLEYSIENEENCFKQTGEEDYCGPNSYSHAQDRLLMNNGDMTFQDKTYELGLNIKSSGLGVVIADINNDQWQDIYVTNDMAHNFLWINQKGQKFTEEAMLRGVAVNYHGKSEASMGVDFGDVDNNGSLDVFMTHLLSETNTLYLNNGNGYFFDSSNEVGLGQPSIGFTGFGAAFLDLDNNSWEDLITVNGEVRAIKEQRNAGAVLPLAQRNQLFLNFEGQFTEVLEGLGGLGKEKVSRGLAIGDIDNDGDTDILVANINDYPQLLINYIGQENHWVGFELKNSHGSMVSGATVEILNHPLAMLKRSRTDASYISARDPRVLIGLGDFNQTVDIKVTWGDGTSTLMRQLEINKYHQITKEGKSESYF